jgi:hypothetical protein
MMSSEGIDFPPRCLACGVSTDSPMDAGALWHGPHYTEVGRAFHCQQCGYTILWLDADERHDGAPTRLLRDLPRWSQTR